MSASHSASKGRLNLETRSIDYVPLAERHGKAWHLWPIWFCGEAHLTTLAADDNALRAQVEGLRQELSSSADFRPGRAVAAAHAAIREHIPFLARDRALDGEIGLIVRLEREGHVLAAAKGV